MSVISETKQRETTRLCAEAGLLLMQYGAESTLAETVTKRIGAALGVPAEVAITANALTITTLCESHCITTVRRIHDRGINMSVTTEVQRAMLDLEAGAIDAEGCRQRLGAIKPFHYPKALVVVAIGASCACFGALAMITAGVSPDLPTCALIFVASAAGMVARQILAAYHFRPLVSFFVSAFVATSIAGLGVKCPGWGALEGQQLISRPKEAMAASVLLLVPGFPLINAISDMVKGHINVGISRLTMAVLLAGATCAGIVLSMSLINVWSWL